MAGVGFDAAITAGAPHELKSRLGPLAYLVSGMRALRGPRAPITLALDGRIEPPRQVRTVVVGNCGKLVAGLVLMPAARVDDGLLDVVSIGPRTILGWLAVSARVLTRRCCGHRIVQHWQGRAVIISAEAPQLAQLDGDAVGEMQGVADAGGPGRPAGARLARSAARMSSMVEIPAGSAETSPPCRPRPSAELGLCAGPWWAGFDPEPHLIKKPITLANQTQPPQI
jgi:YegS C-terminal NAD kinase beta sandwich-like domain